MTNIRLFLLIGLVIIFGGAVLWDIRHNRRQPAYKLRDSVAAYAFLAPALILIFLFVIQPIAMSIWYGFTDYYLLKPNDINFVGLNNFKNLIEEFTQHGDFYNAFVNTGYFVLLVLPLQIGTALGLALLVSRDMRGISFYKIAFFAPVVMSLTVTSLLWMNILRPDEYGLIYSLLAHFGVKPQIFLQNPKLAMNCIIILSAWQGAGFQMMIFLAGLKNIPLAYYEAAEIDGANAWKRFISITMPCLKPTSVFILLTTFIGASKLIIQPMVMTGYKSYTVTLSYFTYMEGYSFKMVGYASAAALLVTVVTGSIAVLQRRLLREEDDV